MRAHVYVSVANVIQVFYRLIASLCSPMSASVSLGALIALALSSSSLYLNYGGSTLSMEHGVGMGPTVGVSLEYEFGAPGTTCPAPGPALRGTSTCADPFSGVVWWRVRLAKEVLQPSPAFWSFMALGGIMHGACAFWWGRRWADHSTPGSRRVEPRRIEDSAPARLTAPRDVRR